MDISLKCIDKNTNKIETIRSKTLEENLYLNNRIIQEINLNNFQGKSGIFGLQINLYNKEG